MKNTTDKSFEAMAMARGFGGSSFGVLPPPQTGASISSVSLNRSIGVAVLSDGRLLQWGDGLCGERLDSSGSSSTTTPLPRPALRAETTTTTMTMMTGLLVVVVPASSP